MTAAPQSFTVKDEWTCDGEFLGRGSFANVYKGHRIQPEPDKASTVAIKVVDISRLTHNNQKLLTHLDTEVKIMHKLKHENIIQLFDTETKTFNNQNFLYMILEFCDGGDLAGYIKENQPLTQDEALHFTRQISQGIKYVRSMSIVHRDLKPQNILLHYTKGKNALPTVKIADFGFARFTLDQFALVQTICGSPLYMAPEVLKAEIYNAKADLWSIGIIVYELLVGRPPFAANSIPQLLKMISEDPVEFPFTLELSSAAKDLVKKLLTSDPNARIGYDEFFNHPWITGSSSIATSPQSWADDSIPSQLRKSSITKLNQSQLYDWGEKFSKSAEAIEYAGDYYLTQSHLKAASLYSKSLGLVQTGLKLVFSGLKLDKRSPEKNNGELNGVSFQFVSSQPDERQVTNSACNPAKFTVQFSRAFNNAAQIKLSVRQGSHEIVEALQNNPGGILKAGNTEFVFEDVRFEKMKTITQKNELEHNTPFRLCVEALQSSSSTTIPLYSNSFLLLSRHGAKIVSNLKANYKRIYNKLLGLKMYIKAKEEIPPAEALLYKFVLQQGAEGGRNEKIYGNFARGLEHYNRALTILDQLLLDVRDTEDKDQISKLYEMFHKRKQVCLNTKKN